MPLPLANLLQGTTSRLQLNWLVVGVCAAQVEQLDFARIRYL